MLRGPIAVKCRSAIYYIADTKLFSSSTHVHELTINEFYLMLKLLTESGEFDR